MVTYGSMIEKRFDGGLFDFFCFFYVYVFFFFYDDDSCCSSFSFLFFASFFFFLCRDLNVNHNDNSLLHSKTRKLVSKRAFYSVLGIFHATGHRTLPFLL